MFVLWLLLVHQKAEDSAGLRLRAVCHAGRSVRCRDEAAPHDPSKHYLVGNPEGDGVNFGANPGYSGGASI